MEDDPVLKLGMKFLHSVASTSPNCTHFSFELVRGKPTLTVEKSLVTVVVEDVDPVFCNVHDLETSI